jgi:NitT/TauT family transport system permease protein
MKQGWAFAWHALMAGEFLILVNPLSLGGRTVNAVTQGEWAVVVSMMIVIVFIGIIVDMAFSTVDRSVRRRYGLIDSATA